MQWFVVRAARARRQRVGPDVDALHPQGGQRPLDLGQGRALGRHELDRGVIRMRGGPLSIHIKGLDELHLTHDNIMMESCNTSFQVHFQSNAKEFANHYNIAQAITAPVLAVAVNSPLLFGQRLWQETRVGRPVGVADVEVVAIPVCHDAADPCGFLIRSGAGSVTVVTPLAGSWFRAQLNFTAAAS